MKKMLFGAAVALGLAMISSTTVVAADVVSITDLKLVQEEAAPASTTLADSHHHGHHHHGHHHHGHHHHGHHHHGHHHHGHHHHHNHGTLGAAAVSSDSIPTPTVALN